MALEYYKTLLHSPTQYCGGKEKQDSISEQLLVLQPNISSVLDAKKYKLQQFYFLMQSIANHITILCNRYAYSI